MIKKISVLCLAIIIAISSVMCFPSMAQEIKSEKTSEVQILEAIGILDASFNAKVPVERGDFAKYVARLWGEVPFSNNAGMIYSDVAMDTDECSAISLLTSKGLLNGYGDGNFKPGTPIKMQDATKVIIEILGYKYLAVEKGGYPTGYLVVAQNLGLFKGVNTERAYFYGDDFATMLYNALTADALIENGFIADKGGTYITTEFVDGKTFLSENLDIHIGEGVITDNSITSLSSNPTPVKQVRIDGVLYNVYNSKFWDMVGYSVEYVYHLNPITNKRTLICAIPEEDSVLTVSSDDFIGLDDFTVKYYDESGKEKKATLSANFDFIYNGRVTVLSDALFENFNLGTVKLINNDGGKDYDVVSLEKYQSFVAEGVNTSQMVLDDGKAQDHVISCDPANYEKALILSDEGKEIAFDTITDGRVISYFINNGYLKLYAVIGSTEGSVDSVSKVSGVEQYKINGLTIPAPAGYTGNKAEVGDYVIAYIDVFGKLVNMKQSTANNLETAFLLKSGQDGIGFTDKYGFKMYTPKNTVITLYAADKIQFNGETVEIKDMTPLPQTVICYETNEEGLIKRIETPVPRDDSYVDGRLMTVNEKESYGYYSGMLDSKVVFTAEGTAAFMIPDLPITDEEGNVLVDEYTEDMMRCVKPSELKDNSSFVMQAYVLSKEALVSKAVVLYETVSTSNSIPGGENLATIVSINNVLDDDDMEVFSVTTRVEGVHKEFTFAEDVKNITLADAESGFVDLTRLKPGDTFRYGTNAEGKIDKLQMIYTSKDGWLSDTSQFASTADYRVEFAYGKVVSTEGNFMRVKFDDEVYPEDTIMQDYYALPYSHYTNVTVINETDRGTTVTYGLIQTAEVGDYIINYRFAMGGAGFVIIKRN